MEIVGYARIAKNASTGSCQNPKNFLGQTCRVYEFAANDDGGVLVMDNEATGLAMFDKKDVIASFKCSVLGSVICPPNLDFISRSAYATKCMTRKGGYEPILYNMVVVASLHKGVFNDDFLWVLERQERAQQQA